MKTMQQLKLEQARRYLRKHGIESPRVQIGALYVPPTRQLNEVSIDMERLQEALLNESRRVRGS